MVNGLKISWMFFCIMLMFSVTNGSPETVIVSQDGFGDFTSVQQAVESFSDSSTQLRRVLIKNGIYREKIFIEKHNILLIGEDRNNVLIVFAISRDEWRCSQMDDWGVATINIKANDVALTNLTVQNSFGEEWEEDKTILCKTDTVSSTKIISRNNHQMALRVMDATRFRAINCYFKSYGGDTMSPWNVENGMFYFKDCTMEGGVDLYCPRGWAYAENCIFIAQRGSAAIWHDGSVDPDSKSVFVKCSFDGYKGFQLGRYHRDAQFYLIGCTFSKNISDQPIYHAPTGKKLKWGHRVYFHDCRCEGGDYDWFKNNMSVISVNPTDIQASWVFGNNWDPLKSERNDIVKR